MSGARAWNRPDRAPALQQNHSFSVVLLTETAIHVPHLSCLSLRNLRARCAPESSARTRAAPSALHFAAFDWRGNGTSRSGVPKKKPNGPCLVRFSHRHRSDLTPRAAVNAALARHEPQLHPARLLRKIGTPSGRLEGSLGRLNPSRGRRLPPRLGPEGGHLRRALQRTLASNRKVLSGTLVAHFRRYSIFTVWWPGFAARKCQVSVPPLPRFPLFVEYAGPPCITTMVPAGSTSTQPRPLALFESRTTVTT